MRRWFGITVVIASAVSLTGCGDGWQAATYPATGRLVINGAPAAGALVQMVARGGPPDERNSRPWAKVQPDGSFELRTYDGKPGAPAGEYGVGITWPFDSEQMGSPDRLGGKFADAASSQLSATLKAEPNQIPEFRLDQVRVESRPRPKAAPTMPPVPR